MVRKITTIYEFEIVYRKGHQNADGLSRRPCSELGCTYCTKESSIARIVLGEDDFEEWQKRQKEDIIISMFLQGKKLGEHPC